MSKKLPSWLPPLARTGYSAKGIVYGTIGILALAAAGSSGETPGSSGALSEISSMPLGSVAIIAIGLGLLAYAAYRLMCAIFDAESSGKDGSGLAKRAGYFGSAVAYTSLGIAALTGLGGGSGGEREAASGVLSMPGGRIILGVIAIGIILAGGFQWVKAIKGSYRSKFTLDSYASGKRKWIERIAKLGLIARGIVFPIIGIFLLTAAFQSDASEVKGLGEALDELRRQSYGTILFTLTAIGMICYAIYCEVLAIYGNFGSK